MPSFLTDTQQKYLITQDWAKYSAQDHHMWRDLCVRQRAVLDQRAFPFYLKCLDEIHVDEDHVPKFDHVNQVLRAKTGWEIVPVNGLIPELDFFQFLADKKFPTTTFIRTPAEIDYLEAPDIFHDLFGHIPMLMQPDFANYMELFGKKGVEAFHAGFTKYIARLYWFTVEFGLINTHQGLRIYGAGIFSSKGESIYCLESDIPKRLEVDIVRILRTDFFYHAFQKMYFVIHDLMDLYQLIDRDLLPFYHEAEKQGDILDYQLIAGDKLFA